MANWDNRHPHDTPKKSRVRGTIAYLEAHKVPYFKEDVFRFNGISHRQGWAMISRASEDRRHHRSQVGEHRGRPPKISNAQLKEMDRIIREEGFEARKLSWLELGFEAGIEGVSARTISRAMGDSMSYTKCIACQRRWVNNSTARDRVAWASTMLQRYPDAEDWHRMRFSDEVQWALGPQGRIYIIRRPGERYCSDCIQQRDEKTDREKVDVKKVHAWAAVGHDFKSDLTFYSIASNSNGKMTQRAYIDQILEPIVKPWIERGDDFALEEDGDSGHGPSKINIVRQWKHEQKLDYYFNCHNSPDLSPIENCWQPPKQYVKKFPHWDESDTRELAHEGWDKISQNFINQRVNSMPKRLKDCIDMDGQMTGW